VALAASIETIRPENFKNYAQQVILAAKDITATIASNEAVVALPARALG
jgi:glycine/serine hydroxymethyltransferase